MSNALATRTACPRKTRPDFVRIIPPAVYAGSKPRICRLKQIAPLLFKGRTVLIVEEGHLLDDDTRLLLETGGAIVIAAASVPSGLTLLTNENIDAAILDLQLNGDAVFPLAERLLFLEIPFIFATAYVSPELSGIYGGFHLCARTTELQQIAEALFGTVASI